MTLAIWCNIGLIWTLTVTVTPKIITVLFLCNVILILFLKDYTTMLSHKLTVAQWTCNSYYAVWLSVTDNVLASHVYLIFLPELGSYLMFDM